MTIWHDAFYKFVPVDAPDDLVAQLTTVCEDAGVLGNVLVSGEGINGMLAGTEEQMQVVRDTFDADERFADMIYKRTESKEMPFKKMRVRLKKEVVPLGIDGVDASKQTGINLSPAEWRELIYQDDVVLIDNRNSFEFKLGHFKNAIDPGVRHFRDFSEYVLEHKDEWQDKKVAMYCTGGIRCEKTTAWMKEDLGMDVYQLEGGIINYFKEIPDADADYDGECFVFDERVALDTNLQETETTLEDIGQGPLPKMSKLAKILAQHKPEFIETEK